MQIYWAADLNAKGELIQCAEYDYSTLERLPGAGDLIVLFSTWIWRQPEEFEIDLPMAHQHLAWRWRASAPSCGIGTLRSRNGLSAISFFVTGLNTQHDTATLQAFQQHLYREFHDSGIEPAFDLTQLQQRPLLATFTLFDPPERADMQVAALADRCFGAAYFRYHRLV